MSREQNRFGRTMSTTIQCNLCSAAHPLNNRPKGNSIDPRMIVANIPVNLVRTIFDEIDKLTKAKLGLSNAVVFVLEINVNAIDVSSTGL